MSAGDGRARYLLGVDVGQTAVKAVIFDDHLRPVAVARRASPVDRSMSRRAERTQTELWSTAADAIAEAVAASSIGPAQIAAVGIAGHGDGLHLVTKDGTAASQAITAMDSRAHREAAELIADADRLKVILEHSGQVPTAGAAGNILRWLLRNDPATIDTADTMLFCKDVIRLHITGELSTDYSDACASFLDTSTAQWSAELVEAYGLPGDIMRLLPPITSSGEIVGHVLAEATSCTGLIKGTPVISGMHDVQAASIGMGALIPGRLALVAGSFTTNGVTTRQTDVDARWQSRLSITPDLRIAMSTSATASPAFDWILALLGVTTNEGRNSILADAAALDPRETVPLILPFLVDSPIGANASSVFAGIRNWHTPAHVVRGALEGIALMHFWHTRALAEKFDWEQPVLLSGGLSRSPLYAQLVANVLRTPVCVVKTAEAGAFGAAAVAGVSVGMFDSIDSAQEKFVKYGPPVNPTPESAGYWSDVRASFDELIAAADPWWLAQETRANRASDYS